MKFSYTTLLDYPLADSLEHIKTADENGYYACYAADETWHKDLWLLYAAAADKPNPTTASYALQIYDVGALNKPKDAAKAASILAQAANDAPSYLRLVSYAARAGDTRTADLAGQKAIDLAPKAQKKLVEKQVEALKKAGQQQQPSG